MAKDPSNYILRSLGLKNCLDQLKTMAGAGESSVSLSVFMEAIPANAKNREGERGRGRERGRER